MVPNNFSVFFQNAYQYKFFLERTPRTHLLLLFEINTKKLHYSICIFVYNYFIFYNKTKHQHHAPSSRHHPALIFSQIFQSLARQRVQLESLERVRDFSKCCFIYSYSNYFCCFFLSLQDISIGLLDLLWLFIHFVLFHMYILSYFRLI